MSWWIPIATMLGTAALSSNQQASRPVKAGNQHLLGNRPVISLSPNQQGYSLMTMPPVSYQASSPGNNIPSAYLNAGGGATDASMSMNQMNLARMGGDPALDPGYKEDYPIPKSSGQPSTEGGPAGLIPWPGSETTNPQRLPKTPEEMAHEVELQKMSDEQAMIRQGISSAGSFLGTMMRPPSAVTVGGYRPNPNLQMFRRRRGLMSG